MFIYHIFVKLIILKSLIVTYFEAFIFFTKCTVFGIGNLYKIKIITVDTLLTGPGSTDAWINRLPPSVNSTWFNRPQL
jgi:hypothetical protein